MDIFLYYAESNISVRWKEKNMVCEDESKLESVFILKFVSILEIKQNNLPCKIGK